MPENLKFPDGFLWGAATSSHQVEGNTHNDWSEWEKSEKRTNYLKSSGLADKYGLDNFISGKACDHYNRYKEDFKLAKELGHNAHRFSIEWSRIEPEEGKFDEKEIQHYRDVIQSLRDLGLEPFVTLWHWPIPLWLRDMGGWKNEKTADYFARYAEAMVKALPGIRFWVTLNEPEIYAFNSYLRGIWPPQARNPFTYFKVLKNLASGHNKAYPLIKAASPEAQVGIAKHNVWFEPADKSLVNRLLVKVADYLWNDYFLNLIEDFQDFIGLNHYFHNRVNWGFNKNANEKVSDMGWELYPESIYHSLRDLVKYNKPIYITENGLADAEDKNRAWFIEETLKHVSRGIEEGIDVRGYFYWSLLDNFEWDKGFWPRFGLVEVDYKTMERKPRRSAFFLKS